MGMMLMAMLMMFLPRSAIGRRRRQTASDMSDVDG